MLSRTTIRSTGSIVYAHDVLFGETRSLDLVEGRFRRIVSVLFHVDVKSLCRKEGATLVRAARTSLQVSASSDVRVFSNGLLVELMFLSSVSYLSAMVEMVLATRCFFP
jgi:hypothetical protein